MLLIPLFFFGCQKKEGNITTVPPVFKPIPFEEMLAKADFVGIVEIVAIPKIIKGQPFLESIPPEVDVRPIAALKEEGVTNKISINWQTKPMPSDDVRRGDKPIKMPGFGKYLVYLKKKKDNTFEWFNENWSYKKMPETPNVIVPEKLVPELFNETVRKWRVIEEVSPFISKVGQPVYYRYYRTRLDDETYEGPTYTWPASNFIIIDLTRKRKLVPKDPGKQVKLQEVVPKGATVIHELELSKHFDLTNPGEYWVLTGFGLLRFEVSDKIRIIE